MSSRAFRCPAGPDSIGYFRGRAALARERKRGREGGRQRRGERDRRHPDFSTKTARARPLLAGNPLLNFYWQRARSQFTASLVKRPSTNCALSFPLSASLSLAWTRSSRTARRVVIWVRVCLSFFLFLALNSGIALVGFLDGLISCQSGTLTIPVGRECELLFGLSFSSSRRTKSRVRLVERSYRIDLTAPPARLLRVMSFWSRLIK